jgi:hypothetical protein
MNNKLTINRSRFEMQENLERKIGSGQKCFSPSKTRTALKKQTSSISYRDFGWKICYKIVKNYLKNIGVHRKSKKFTPKTKARQQSVIKARLNLQTTNV